VAEDLPISERLTIPGSDLEWRAVRASGPGGQNVNKVATKVELRFDLEGCQVLKPAVRDRLRALAGRRLDADGRLVLTSQAGRSQSANLEAARSRLADLIREALVPPRRRRKTRPTRASRERRLEKKRQQSDKKRGRGRIRRGDT
jgi:ribosome-associated protein